MLPHWISQASSALTQKPDPLRWVLFLSFATIPTVCKFLQGQQIYRRASSLVTRKLIGDSKLCTTGSRRSISSDNSLKYWKDRDDPNYFLQEVLGEKALTWVKRQNQQSMDLLGDPTGSPLYQKILNILDSKEKIPYFTQIHDHIYNFWQDEVNPRGILRRTTLQNYQNASQTVWETVLDIDALGSVETESWVYKGHLCLELSEDEINNSAPILRALIYLSRGGSDAIIIREFDFSTKSFVTDRPFHVNIEAKTNVVWRDLNTLWIGTNLDSTDGTNALRSMTSSGYPRIVREWKRGDALTAESTKMLYEGEDSDVTVFPSIYKHGYYQYAFFRRSPTFFTEKAQFQLLRVPSTQSETLGPFLDTWFTLPFPDDMDVTVFQNQFLLQLRSDWKLNASTNYSAGSLVSVPIVDVLSAIKKHAETPSTEWTTFLSNMTVLFAPSSTTSLDSFSKTKDYLIVTSLDTVKTRLSFWRLNNSQWRWIGAESEARIRGVSVSVLDRHHNNVYLLVTSSFVTPTQLLMANAEDGVEGIASATVLRSLTRQFDLDPSSPRALTETQYEAVSADGTKIPYFVIAPQCLQYHGRNPTLLYGYGGFEVSLTPSYASVLGATWLNTDMMMPSAASEESESRHTVYVVANIRGGGEFGPTWHQAALREHRHRAYEDFIAVAEDIIARRITSSDCLAIRGGSNGGLLVGNAMTLRPDLFAAVCCAVPLLDMKTYHTLLAGASWMAEYGNPDVADDWAFLQKYSAYHQIDPAAILQKQYPALLMTTSTRDDRVHPYHARCFVKRLIDPDNKYQPPVEGSTANSNQLPGPVSRNLKIRRGEVLYYENIEGGHGGAADNKQQAFMNALYIEFLRRTLISS
jgi:prolyl oligopeptidase